MPEDSHHRAEHKEPFIERIFDHQHHKQEDSSQSDKKDGSSSHEGRLEADKDDLKKAEQGLKNYYEEDKELEAEGETYGGLM